MRNFTLLLWALVAASVHCKPSLEFTKLKKTEQNEGDDKFVLPVIDDCASMRCGYYSKCVVDGNGKGKCVCDFDCDKKQELPFCDADGNQYKNMCEIRKRICEAESEFFYVPGKCQGKYETTFLFSYRFPRKIKNIHCLFIIHSLFNSNLLNFSIVKFFKIKNIRL